MPRITSSTLPISRTWPSRVCTFWVESVISLVITAMAWAACCTCSRPCWASRLVSWEAVEVEAALRATSSTAAVIWLTAVAACCTSSCWRTWPREVSSVTACSSSAAAASWLAAPAICCTVSFRLRCMPPRACSSWPASSRRLLWIGRVRSPWATRSALETASRIGATIRRVMTMPSARAQSVANSRPPVSVQNALSYVVCASTPASALCRLLDSTMILKEAMVLR